MWSDPSRRQPRPVKQVSFRMMELEFSPRNWPPESPLELATGQVDLWWFPAAGPHPPTRRAERLDQLLRGTLSAYAGIPANDLRLARSGRGKPYLDHACSLSFNVSDCQSHCLLAVSTYALLGIDLERLDRQMDVQGLARRWFHPQEAHALETLPDTARREAFLKLWTAKEAACKATGSGISGMLGQWHFALDDDPPRLLDLPLAAGDRDTWRFVRITPAAGFTAVLATQGTKPRIHGFEIRRC